MHHRDQIFFFFFFFIKHAYIDPTVIKDDYYSYSTNVEEREIFVVQQKEIEIWCYDLVGQKNVVACMVL